MREVGSYIVHDSDVPLLVSPDGEGVCGNQTTLVFEFKCPSLSKPYHSPVHYEVPLRYLPQLLCEMNGNDVTQKCLYISWTAESTTVFTIENDRDLWVEVLAILSTIYLNPVYPRKKPAETAGLLEKFRKFKDDKITFLGEFPSCRAIPCRCSRSPVNSPDGLFHHHKSTIRRQPKSGLQLISDVQQLLKVTKDHLNKAALLLRPLAKDVLVYVLSDLDRTKKDDSSVLSFPVFYGFASKKLPLCTVRSITSYVYHEVCAQGFHIASIGYDGQFYKLAVESNIGTPLTLLQCQKQLWAETTKMSPDELRKYILREVEEQQDNDVISKGNVADRENTDQQDFLLLPTRENLTAAAFYGVKAIDTHLSESVTHTVQHITVGCCETLVTELKSTAMERTRAALRLAGQRKSGKSISAPKTDDELPPSIFDDLPIAIGNDPIVELSLQEIDLAFCCGNTEEFDDDILCDIMSLIEEDQMQLQPDTLINDAYSQNEEQSEVNGSPDPSATIDYKSILQRLRVTSCENKWKSVNDEEFQMLFNSVASLSKFTVEELKVIYRHILGFHPSLPVPGVKPHLKAEFINAISMWCGDGSQLDIKPTKQRGAGGMISSTKAYLCSLKKAQLSIIAASMKWPKSISDWKKAELFHDGCSIDSENGDTLSFDQWFTQPEKIQESTVASFCDFHHIKTNTRCHISRRGYPAAGISREAYMDVARNEKNNKTGLTLAHVEDVLGPQDSSKADLMFSEEVQLELKRLGWTNEAAFNELMRNWYKAVDERGISAFQRIVHLYQLRSWLLTFLRELLSFFPPPTTHVSTIPIQNFEGLLISCERIPQMYNIVPKGNFNVRALGSQMNETFFSSFADLDSQRNYKGVLKPSEVPKAMSRACKLLELRMDPSRKFAFVTKRNQTYPIKEFELASDSRQIEEFPSPFPSPLSPTPMSPQATGMISPKNNPYFDTPTTRVSKRKSGKISRPDEPARGMLGVRQYHRSDDTHVLAHVRAGMSQSDI